MANAQNRSIRMALCLALLSGQSGAQVSAEFDPLMLPGTVLMCRSVPVTPADSAVFVFQYLDPAGLKDHRRTSVAFDSAGRPLYMIIVAPETEVNGDPVINTVIARFSPKALGDRVIVRNRRASPTDSVVPHPTSSKQELTEGDISRAKTLANWFWAH